MIQHWPSTTQSTLGLASSSDRQTDTHMDLVLSFKRWRQEEQEFKASLGYSVTMLKTRAREMALTALAM